MNDLIRHLSCAAALLSSTGFGLRDLIRIAATIIVGAALGWHDLSATAGELAAEARTSQAALVELERAFWLCDHAATNRTVSPEVGILCVAVTEDLQQRKFGGSSEQMFAWWHARRGAEHRRLDEAGAN